MSTVTKSYSYSDLRDSIKIGNYSSIAPDCIFQEPGDNHLCVYNKKCVYTDNYLQQTGDKLSKGEIEIGNDVWIGRGVKFLPGVKVGDGAIIGAWSVVSKNIPEYAVAVGSPIVIKRFRFTSTQIEKLKKIKWWNWSPKKVAEVREDMLDINVFLKKYAI